MKKTPLIHGGNLVKSENTKFNANIYVEVTVKPPSPLVDLRSGKIAVVVRKMTTKFMLLL